MLIKTKMPKIKEFSCLNTIRCCIFLFFLCILVQSTTIIRPGSVSLKISRKTTTNKHIFRLCFGLSQECPKLFCGLGIDHRRRKTIALWNSLGKAKSYPGHHCMSSIYNMGLDARKTVFGVLRTTQAQTSLRIRAV